MPPVTLARHAMATRFEIVLHGGNPGALRAAGEEALNEIERLEAQLSLYRPASEILQLNARADRESVRVSPELFALLQHARRLHDETGGAFDITIAPLLRCWGFMNGSGKIPDAAELAEARAKTGLHLVRLDERNYTVRFERPGVMLDLGAIGKGYAVEKAAEILREAGVTSALIHGGTSTIYAIGCPPEAASWNIALPDAPCFTAEPRICIALQDEAMSVSAVWGKSFESNGKTYGHVLDPRAGEPASTAVFAAVMSPSATETDALSTALLVVGSAGHQQLSRLRSGLKTLLVSDTETGFCTESHGIAPHRAPASHSHSVGR